MINVLPAVPSSLPSQTPLALRALLISPLCIYNIGVP
jgi:hypothetical protein